MTTREAWERLAAELAEFRRLLWANVEPRLEKLVRWMWSTPVLMVAIPAAIIFWVWLFAKTATALLGPDILHP